jgi:hypothetical protein
VAQTGGRAGDAKLGDLAGRVALVLLTEARERAGVSAADAERIERASLELPRPPGATFVIVRSPAGSTPVEATLVRGPKDAREDRGPEVVASGIGLLTLRMDPGDASPAIVRLRRAAELPPARPTKVRVDALVPTSDGKPPRLSSIDVELPITGKPVELAWTNGAFTPP